MLKILLSLSLSLVPHLLVVSTGEEFPAAGDDDGAVRSTRHRGGGVVRWQLHLTRSGVALVVTNTKLT